MTETKSGEIRWRAECRPTFQEHAMPHYAHEAQPARGVGDRMWKAITGSYGNGAIRSRCTAVDGRLVLAGVISTAWELGHPVDAIEGQVRWTLGQAYGYPARSGDRVGRLWDHTKYGPSFWVFPLPIALEITMKVRRPTAPLPGKGAEMTSRNDLRKTIQEAAQTVARMDDWTRNLAVNAGFLRRDHRPEPEGHPMDPDLRDQQILNLVARLRGASDENQRLRVQMEANSAHYAQEVSYFRDRLAAVEAVLAEYSRDEPDER